MNGQGDQPQEQLSSQNGMQDIDEQQLEEVTGGGCFSCIGQKIKSVFSSSKTSDPTKNPYYDPNWKPPTTRPPSANFTKDEAGNPLPKASLQPGDPNRIRPQDAIIQTIHERL